MSTPDPDPANTPGLEPGGGVPVGETPPGEASTTEGVSFREPKPPARRTAWIAFVGVGVVVALVVLFGVGYIVGLL